MGEQRQQAPPGSGAAGQTLSSRSSDVLSLGSFIVLGLPDGMLGTAWPAMRTTFGAPVGELGLLIGATSLAVLGPAITVLAVIMVAAELLLGRLAPVGRPAVPR